MPIAMKINDKELRGEKLEWALPLDLCEEYVFEWYLCEEYEEAKSKDIYDQLLITKIKTCFGKKNVKLHLCTYC